MSLWMILPTVALDAPHRLSLSHISAPSHPWRNKNQQNTETKEVNIEMEQIAPKHNPPEVNIFKEQILWGFVNFFALLLDLFRVSKFH